LIDDWLENQQQVMQGRCCTSGGFGGLVRGSMAGAGTW
jgi:hypothetical protein